MQSKFLLQDITYQLGSCFGHMLLSLCLGCVGSTCASVRTECVCAFLICPAAWAQFLHASDPCADKSPVDKLDFML